MANRVDASRALLSLKYTEGLQGSIDTEYSGGGMSTGVSRLTIRTMADVKPERVKWLWDRWIPFGKLVILAGDPGEGKSFLSLDIGSRVTLGAPWPDGGNAEVGNVMIITAEDGLADTVRPRLDLLGADVSRVHAIDISVKEGDLEVGLSLTEHLPSIEAAVTKYSALLLIIDPLLAITGRDTDTYKSSEVRPVLALLSMMAERTGCAVLGIMHPNKRSGEGNPIYRVSSSLDFVAAPRGVLGVGRLPDDPDRRVLASLKSNLSAPPDSLSYYFDQDGCFRWGGVVDVDAAAIFATQPANHEGESTLKETMGLLEEILASGPVSANEVRREARELGIKDRTLDRAKAKLSVLVKRIGVRGRHGGGRWLWMLPGMMGDIPEDGALNTQSTSDTQGGTRTYGNGVDAELLRTPNPAQMKLASLTDDEDVLEVD